MTQRKVLYFDSNFFWCVCIYINSIKIAVLVGTRLRNNFPRRYCKHRKPHTDLCKLNKWITDFNMTFCPTKTGIKSTPALTGKRPRSSIMFVMKLRFSFDHFRHAFGTSMASKTGGYRARKPLFLYLFRFIWLMHLAFYHLINFLKV